MVSKKDAIYIVIIKSEKEFIELCNLYMGAELMVYDLETSGFKFYADKIGCITMSFDGITGYYVNWNFVNKEKLNELLGSVGSQIGANLKFDVKFLWYNGIPNATIHEDVIAMGHVLDETRSNSLKTLAYLYTNYGGYDYQLDEYKRKTHIDNYLDIPEDILQKYATMDSIVTFKVFIALRHHMRQLDAKFPNEKGTNHSLEEYYKERRIPATRLYADMEYFGVPINKEKLALVRQKTLDKIEDLRNKMAESFHISHLFDFKSPTKLGKLLQERGWEDFGRTKAGGYKCGDDQLERWAEIHPEAKLIQEFRTANVFLSTFIGMKGEEGGWENLAVYHPEDGSYRLHAQYNPMGTESGRTKCRNPNLMNVPTRGALAKGIKSCVSSPNDDEYYLVTVDYKSLQMCLAAADGEDASLMELFKSSREADVHTRTSYSVFVKGNYYDIDEIDVEQDGKKFTFLGGQEVMTSNRGNILARELTEDDTLDVSSL